MDNPTLFKICRVCLDSDKQNYISLSDTYKQFLLFEHINAITNVKIKYKDGHPDKICEQCFNELCTAVDFKEKCEQSNDTLINKKIKKEEVNIDCNLTVKKEKHEIKMEGDNTDDNFYYEYSDDNSNDPVNNSDSNLRKSRAINLNLKCNDCKETFKSKCKLRVHWKKTHMPEALICTNCKRTFKSFKAFHLHKQRKTKSCLVATDKNLSIEGIGKNRVFICKECNYKTSRIKDMSAHLVTHSGERPYQCHLCPNTYTQHSSLQSHIEGTHKSYFIEITCQFCGKYVKGRRNVYRHLKGHTDGEATCPICKKVMKKKSFHIHMKRHTGVKSFTCEKCASTFYTSAELCNHKRWVHIKSEEMLKCDLCDYKCVKAYNMKQHKSKHTDKNLPCTICGRFYLNLEKLSAHQKMHYGEKKYSCPQCEMKFYKRDSVRKHMKVKHAVTLIDETVTVPVEVKTENVGYQPEDLNAEKEPSSLKHVNLHIVL